MRKTLLSLLLFSSYISPGFSLSSPNMPDSFHIKEQACRGGGCLNLVANEKKIGALLPKANTLGTFEYVNTDNQRQITIRFTGTRLSDTVYQGNEYTFDVYGKNRVLLGKLIMRSDFGRVAFSSFKLFAPDEQTVLAYGNADLASLKTKHLVFLKDSTNIIATLSRPLFTLSHDSDVTLIDKQQFFANQDASLLPAILAIYSIHDIQMGVDLPETVSNELFQELQMQVQKTAEAQYPEQANLPITDAQIKAAAYLLHQRFHEQFDESSLTDEEKIKQFIYFGCDLVASHTLTPNEEQAVLTVLTNSLMNM